MADTKLDKYEYEFKQDYLNDWDIHRNYITTFDAYEAMLLGQVYDSVSNSIDGSKITDSYATTLAKERADRVIAKLPDGVTESVGRADVGKAAFMDILRQKWIYPNANAQHPFLEKLNMWQLYSSVYGYMPMFYDWNVSNSGYVGPDCWLWNPRNLVPQQGKTSIEDMDYVTALTWVSKKYLQNIIDAVPEQGENDVESGGWDMEALQELVNRVGNETTNPDQEKDTRVMRTRLPQSAKRGICLATRYEAGPDGRWCTFAPDHGYVKVRELANPHKNGRIPFVIKYSQPLFDSFYGLGDFQRAKPLQFARDGLVNFYFKGIKMNLIPPIIANANGVLKHTLDYREGAVMMETIPNSIRRLETSTAGLATYQAAQSSLTGSLLSLYGTQNASIPGSEALNPSQGRTPAAIGMYSDKEATRDGAERRHLEAAIEELTDGFFSLVANIGTEDIPVSLFSGDIEDIFKSGMEDVVGLFSSNFQPDGTMTAGDLRIDPAKLKGVEYRFNITTNSTAKLNKQAQEQALEGFIGVISKMQNVLQQDPRVKVNWDKIMQSYQGLTDIPGVDEFITIDENAQPQPEPQAQSATAITSPGGAVHESADLTKLYLGTTDEGLKAQIIQAMGFQPSPPPGPQPTVTPGGLFRDPELGAVAEQIHKL